MKLTLNGNLLFFTFILGRYPIKYSRAPNSNFLCLICRSFDKFNYLCVMEPKAPHNSKINSSWRLPQTLGRFKQFYVLLKILNFLKSIVKWKDDSAYYSYLMNLVI